jgi:subtilisin family serine protease
MKRTIYIFGLFLAFLLCCFWTKAQSFYEKHFYYYKGEEIVLDLDDTRIFIVSENEYKIGDKLSILGIDFTVENSCNIDMSRYKITDTIYNINFITLPPINYNVFFTDLVTAENIDHTKYFDIIQAIQDYANIIKVSPSYFYLEKRVGISNNFYVKLFNEKDFQMLCDLAMRHSIQILGNNEFMPLWFTLFCSKETPLSTLEAANMFHELQLFEYSEPEILYYDIFASNDEFFPDQWGLRNTGQYCDRSDFDIRAEEAWVITTGSPNIVTAIYDQGFEMDHPDLVNNVYGTGYDATTNTTPAKIRGKHGTPCAGIAGAQQNNLIGVSGVAPDGKLMSISINLDDWSTPELLADGFNWAWSNGADIISCSWGGYAPSQIIDNAITTTLTEGRNGKGTVVVFAAGNDDNTNIRYPGNSNPDIIVVGGIAPDGVRKSKSPISCDGESGWGACYGAELDVVAPCVLIPTTDLQGEAGYNPSSPFSSYGHGDDYQNQDYTQWFGGTSAACPHVAGVAALVLSVNPNLIGQQVRYTIESTAQKINDTIYNYSTHLERPNGLWHEEMGYGLVDAHAAVLAALETICYKGLPFVHGVINQNTTWNTPVHATGSIIISNGATLTITDSVWFESEAKITVQSGGKLIIDGGTLTNACEGVMWQGIIAEGYAFPAPIPLHSFVELRNGATIENAICGIHATNGGQIEATDANFTNNYTAAQIDIYSEGIFTNSQFIINDNYIEYIGATRKPAQLIANNSLKTVKISGCTFSYQTTSLLKYYAIRAFNSSLTVDTQTTFSGFWYGIDASNSGGSPAISIEGCGFSDNKYGITLNAINAPCIIDNDFILTLSDACGLDISNSTEYTIERNTFVCDNSTLPTKGIVISNSGRDENQIYNNNFYDLEVGIQALERNSSQGWISEPPIPTGLQFLCNYFDNTQQIDILVGDPPNIPYIAHSIRPNQGDSQQPAGNIFITQCTRPHISNYSSYPIHYYYGKYEQDESPCNTVGVVNKEPLELYSDCPPMGKSGLSLSQYDEWNSMYEYWLVQLFEVEYNSEEYHLLLNKVSFYSAMKDNYFNLIIVAVMHGKMKIFEELGYYENLRYLFNYRNNYTDNLSIIETCLAENNHEEALLTLVKMYELFEVTEEDIMELRGLETYIIWLQQLEKEQNSIYKLSEIELDYLIDYVKTNNGRGKVFVSNILCGLYDICLEEGETEKRRKGEKEDEKENLTLLRSYALTDSNNALENIKLVPNPTTGELTITNRSPVRGKLSEANYELEITSIEVFDVYGRKLNHLFISSSNPKIDISNLYSGIYFIKIVTEHGEIVKKVVKQ